MHTTEPPFDKATSSFFQAAEAATALPHQSVGYPRRCLKVMGQPKSHGSVKIT